MRKPARRTPVLLAVAHVLAAAGGIAAALLLASDLPGLETLKVPQFAQTTQVFDRHGEPLAGFAEQHRTVVPLARISPLLRTALLATEDPRFYAHIGVDPRAVGRAAAHSAANLKLGAEGGGSTITQQLARGLYLSPQKTMTRKAKEALLSILIEKQFSKDEILELYCNRIYLGHGRYGFEAASQFYFGKPARTLTLPEAALLAGLPQRPEGLSPIRYPDRALRRRNHVLDRMVAEGVLPAKEAAAAKKAPLGVADAQPAATQMTAAYFTEEVRRWVMKQYGEDGLYREGLVVRSTLEPKLQAAAERAVKIGLEALGRRQRRLPKQQFVPPSVALESWQEPAWRGPLRVDDVVPAVVLDSDDQRAVVRIGARQLTLGPGEIAWSGISRVRRALPARAIVQVKVLELDAAGGVTKADLAGESDAEAALLALDPATGEIMALVGGKNFAASEFDRAMQAKRQAGSAFKPLIFAAGLEKGFLPTQIVRDTPIVMTEPGIPEPYQPENYDRQYEGLVTLRSALEHSRNLPTVRLLDALSYEPAVEMAKRLGVATDLKPYPSLALGAFEVRLVDLVAAYGAFVNGGLLVTPQLVKTVETGEHATIHTARPQTTEVLDPAIAGMMVSMLEGVCLRGTAAEAQRLGRPVAGKTGTTDDFTDAWFVGFTPGLAVGVWVGYDTRKTLGHGETGALAALPIWMKFLEDGLTGTPAGAFPEVPGLRQVTIDSRSGLRPGSDPGCRHEIEEVLPSGRDPSRTCSARDALRLALPYPLQRFAVRHDGTLALPPDEAARVVALTRGNILIDDGGRAVRWTWVHRSHAGRPETMTGSIPLGWKPEDWRRYVTRKPLAEENARLARGEPHGIDGWPAEVRTINRTGNLLPLDGLD